MWQADPRTPALLARCLDDLLFAKIFTPEGLAHFDETMLVIGPRGRHPILHDEPRRRFLCIEGQNTWRPVSFDRTRQKDVHVLVDLRA